MARIQRGSVRFSIGAVLTAMLSIALVFAAWRELGNRGLAPALAIVTCLWFALSRTKTPSLDPINRERMTVVEFCSALAICLILHGLMLPAVTSQSRPPAPAAPPVSAPPLTANAPESTTLDESE